MYQEIEAKFLDTDHAVLRERLEILGAECVYPQRLMRRRNFDFPDKRLDAMDAWVRLRDEGDKIELMLKHRLGDKLGDVHEVAVIVDDFEKATRFLLAIGMVQKMEQESRRELWRYGDIEIMLDEWPWVKPFVEVEGPTPKAVEAFSKKLGLEWSQAIFDTVEPVYYNEFDVTREQIHSLKTMRFSDPVPLSFKRKAK